MALAILFSVAQAFAAVTQEYYSSVEGKSGANLFDAISSCAAVGFKSIGYNNLYSAYKQTDNLNGEVWDMYSNCGYAFSNTCGNYSVECDCYNREHSIPQSWWGGGTGNQGNDIFHVLPTDGKVNGMRSNYPYGEVGSATYTSNNGSKKGNSIISGYSEVVFEPIDEYKGDIARGILGTMIKWKGTWTQGNGAAMFNGDYTQSGNYGLTAYGVTLLMKWHRQDPVSQKEIDRNNGIQATQGNRNPFIDYPYLAEYIWGDKAGETVAFADLVGSFEADFIPGESDGSRINSTEPAITSPKGTVAFGAVEVGKTATQTIAVKGRNLTDAVTLAITGANGSLFTLSTATVSTDDALAGNNITITYAPTAEGMHTATLTLTSNGATDMAVTLTGNGAVVYKVTYDAGTGTPEVAASNETAVGTGVVLATATPSASCTDWTFAGWATAPVGETQTAPELLLAGDTYHPTANCTLYAVYKMTEENSESSNYNTKVTSLTAGDNIVIYYPAGGLALTATASGAKLSGVATTVESGSITSLGDGAVMLTVEASGENIRFKNGDNYLICPSTGGGLSFGTATDYADWVFEESNGIQYLKNVNAKYSGSTAQYLEYYNGSFTTYKIGTGSAYVFEFYKFGSATYATSPSCQLCTLTGIALNTDNAKKEFYVGDAFDSGNLTVTASYSDCEPRTVVPASVSTPDMDKAGTKTVTVSYTENGATQTATYDITVNTKPTYAVTFDAGTGFCATPETLVVQGESLTLPEATLSDECLTAGWTFAGWATAKVAETTDQPTLLKASEAYTPEANCTLYAVYKKADENSEAGNGSSNGDYEKITAAPTDWSGDYILVYEKSETEANVWTGVDASNSYETTTIANEKIASTFTPTATITIAAITGGYSILVNGNTNDGKYISGTSGSNKVNFGTDASINTLNYNECAIITSNTSVMRYNSSTNQFRYYKSGSYSSQKPVQLYKKSAGSATVTTYNSTPDCKQDVTYAITFVDEDGTELQKTNVKENALPQYTGAEPTKQTTEQYAYTFAGWTPEVVAATANATYTATYTATVRRYTVTFVNADGSTLQQSEWEYGQTPTYVGTPTKAATAEYTYTFDKWEPVIAAVTGEATYKATYTQTPVPYLLTWNLDGGTASGSYTPAGQTAFGTPLTAPTVTKEGYNFAGWNPTVAATMPAANTTYTATWVTIAPTKYAISTSNSTGGTCKADKAEAEAGETVTLTATPDAGYELAGWTVFDGNANEVTVTNDQFTMPASGVEVEAIFAEIVYSVSSVLTNATAAADNPTTATISTEKIILTYAAAEGYELPTSISVTMGSTVLIDDDHYIWEAAKGKLDIMFDGVTDNITVTIAATPKTYGVLLDKNGHGVDDGLVYILYQGGIDADNCLWVTPNEGYTLNGYYTAATGGAKVIEANGNLVANVAGYTNGNGHWTRADEDLTLYAQWTAQTFAVTFVDYDGTVLATQTVAYGQAATAPENPTRTGYTFTGWDTAFDHVTTALTVTATYEKNTETAIGNATAAEPVCHMANGTLHITGLAAGSRIALYDSTGRLLATRADCAETETFALANGVYIVQVTANGKTTQTKIVK